jgi:hypothetical protein
VSKERFTAELCPVTPNLREPLDLPDARDLSQFSTLLGFPFAAELLLALFFFESNLFAAELLPEFLSIDLDLKAGCMLSPCT